jgi:hypothetical protein
MANEGFAQIRNGLKEHIEAGKLCPTDLGVYTFLHMYCDYATGIYTGTALGIAFRFGDASFKGMVNKSLARLKKIKFINFRAGNGKRGGYRILLDKFEPTFGELRGSRLNAWKTDVNGNPIYDAGTVEERSRDGEGTVEGRLRKSQGRVRERVPYIQTIQTGKPTDLHTSSDIPGDDDDAATLPSVPTEGGTGKTNLVEPVTLAPLVPLSFQDESAPVTPTPYAAIPPMSVAHTEELADIRLWNTPAFGVSAERLRNCLNYVLDYYENNYYRKNPPTVASMGRERFVVGLNEHTPIGWTLETHGKSKLVKTNKVETDDERETREYRERIKQLKKEGKV